MRPRPATRAGFTLIELALSMAIFSAMMVFMTVHLQREARGMRQLQSLSQQERLVGDLMAKIEAQLEFAQGEVPAATLASALPSGETFVVDVDSSGSFPDRGILLIDAGNGSEERVRYDDSDPDTGAFLMLDRGVQGGAARSHASGSVVLWAGTAAVLEEQAAPVAGSFDGQSRELLADLFYRGDGSGFSYRVPVDPTGGTSFLTPTGVRWGALVGARPTEDGRACLYFEPVAVLQEVERNFDLNRDGDLLDVFDLGRIRQRSWDAVDGDNASSDVPLCPPMILQERDAWGSDLDNDGFEDPMFLWTPLAGRLRVRVFALVGTINQAEVVKRYETVIHLRNGAAQ
jgi:prepilin-type N-terminal cleavage/methylation domain-containing protein